MYITYRSKVFLFAPPEGRTVSLLANVTKRPEAALFVCLPPSHQRLNVRKRRFLSRTNVRPKPRGLVQLLSW